MHKYIFSLLVFSIHWYVPKWNCTRILNVFFFSTALQPCQLQTLWLRMWHQRLIITRAVCLYTFNGTDYWISHITSTHYFWCYSSSLYIWLAAVVSDSFGNSIGCLCFYNPGKHSWERYQWYLNVLSTNGSEYEAYVVQRFVREGFAQT